MLRKVYLEGEIGDKFGHEFEMDVSSFGEAMSCFETNFEDFRKYLIESSDKGIGFICSVEGKGIEHEDELLLQYPEGSLTIQAVPLGSKSGGLKIIIGVILIAAAIITQQYWLLAEGAVLSGPQALFIYTTMAVGVSLTLSGIQQLMAPDPSVDGQQQDESYLFGGSQHNIVEGDPVPILYGELRVPGRPISFEIKNANRSFVDYSQEGFDFILPGETGDGTTPNTGPSYDEDNSKDTEIPVFNPA